MQIKNGSLLLFRLLGVNVYINWTWVLVAAAQIYWNKDNKGFVSGLPHPIAYGIALYLSLFLIVLIHEFGHALACKSVGGRADRIILWPLGGVAFVQPPQRPGAYLWSIAAGPLVNVVLLPLTIVPAALLAAYAPHLIAADFMADLAVVNGVLLVFNMLPIYPLDGGQILRSLLWFVMGRSTSLIVAAAVGLVGAAALALLAILVGGVWLIIMAGFMAMQSVLGLRMGMSIHRMEKMPRYQEVQCPNCGQNPPAGAFWGCPCGMRFDTFATGAQCPNCGRRFETTSCPLCGVSAPLAQWYPQQPSLTASPQTPSA